MIEGMKCSVPHVCVNIFTAYSCPPVDLTMSESPANTPIQLSIISVYNLAASLPAKCILHQINARNKAPMPTMHTRHKRNSQACF